MSSHQIVKVDRRTFLKAMGAAATAGLTLGVPALLPGCTSARFSNGWQAWIHIGPDGSITLFSPRMEMGQGVLTSLGALVADELDADWSHVKVEHAPLDQQFGSQITQDSSSIRDNFSQMEQLGATARSQLIRAAAEVWQVAVNTCTTDSGRVIHTPSGRQMRYGELAERAAELPLQPTIPLQKPERRLVGRPIPRLDTPDIVAGKRAYTGDIMLPGMLVATIVHSPQLGGRVDTFDATDTLRMSGVVDVVNLGHAVAIVARNTWSALQGQRQLKVHWTPPARVALDTDAIVLMLRKACAAPGISAIKRGNVGLPRGDSVALSAEYCLPFDAHATMEPAICIAHVQDHSCEIWAPTQSPWSAYREALDYGLSKTDYYLERLALKLTGRGHRIKVHVMPMGGGFGRRVESDYVQEAVRISRAVRAPVKLQWSREEDLANDFFRPASVHQVSALLDSDGLIHTWQHRIAGAGVLGYDAEFPYDCANVSAEISSHEVDVPTGPMRSTGHTPVAFARESFMDELAKQANIDPLSFRIRQLTKSPRLRRTLEVAAELADWNSPPPAGHARGIALHPFANTHLTEIVEVSVNEEGIRVHKVVCAVDCGFAVNPNGVKAQIEGAIVFGLSSALKSAISVKNGAVEQSNFHNFRLLQMHEAPEIVVQILESDQPPGGVGELGVPPVAPAVANAVFALTGRRLRDLPLRI